MSETNMWAGIQPKLRECGIGTERLTDRQSPGVPDVLYTSRSAVTGLLELKWLDRLPQDLTRTPLLTYGPHGLTTDQAAWLNRWARRGGIGGVLLHVKREAEWWYWRAVGDPWWVTWIRSVDAAARCRNTAPWPTDPEPPCRWTRATFTWELLVAELTRS